MMKTRQYEIATRGERDGEVVKRKVRGEPVGEHLAVRRDDRAMILDGARWCVDHVPTGFGVVRNLTKAHAREVARVLAAVADWSRVEASASSITETIPRDVHTYVGVVRQGWNPRQIAEHLTAVLRRAGAAGGP